MRSAYALEQEARVTLSEDGDDADRKIGTTRQLRPPDLDIICRAGIGPRMLPGRCAPSSPVPIILLTLQGP